MFGLEAVFVELLFKLAIALFALIGVRFALMWFDIISQVVRFGDWINEADDMSKAVYFGCRFIAVCILVGLALS